MHFSKNWCKPNILSIYLFTPPMPSTFLVSLAIVATALIFPKCNTILRNWYCTFNTTKADLEPFSEDTWICHCSLLRFFLVNNLSFPGCEVGHEGLSQVHGQIQLFFPVYDIYTYPVRLITFSSLLFSIRRKDSQCSLSDLLSFNNCRRLYIRRQAI